MNDRITVSLFGGDERQARLACMIAKNGFKTMTYGTDFGFCDLDTYGIERKSTAEEAAESADAVIFPLPAVKNGIYLNERSESKTPAEKILDAVPSHALIFAGKTDLRFAEMCKKRSLALFDYYREEEFTIKNALLTAEGALHIFTNEKRIAVFGSRILVLGSGRVAKCTARIFSALGAHVTLMARNRAELSWAGLSGYDTADLEKKDERLRTLGKEYDAVINTIPVTFIKGESLHAIPEGTLYLELASVPYGIDEDEAKLHGIRVIKAPAIPGKYAPESAARIIYDVIEPRLRGREKEGRK